MLIEASILSAGRFSTGCTVKVIVFLCAAFWANSAAETFLPTGRAG